MLFRFMYCLVLFSVVEAISPTIDRRNKGSTQKFKGKIRDVLKSLPDLHTWSYDDLSRRLEEISHQGIAGKQRGEILQSVLCRFKATKV